MWWLIGRTIAEGSTAANMEKRSNIFTSFACKMVNTEKADLFLCFFIFKTSPQGFQNRLTLRVKSSALSSSFCLCILELGCEVPVVSGKSFIRFSSKCLALLFFQINYIHLIKFFCLFELFESDNLFSTTIVKISSLFLFSFF